MRSPILALEKSISGAAFNIAPERSNDLLKSVHLRRFSLALSEDKLFSIRVNTVTHEAILPIASLEYIWCCTYTFYVLYQEYTLAQKSGVTAINLQDNQRVSDAICILNWASSNMQLSGTDQWPDNTPRPDLGCKYSDIVVANELFLAATAWIIHHEIAHVILNHSSCHSIYSIQQEKEADIHATQWILSTSNIELETQKRQLGIVTAILAMQFVDEPKGPNTYIKSHPSSIERLHYILDEAKVSDDSLICAFAATALQFQLSQFCIKASLEGTSIRDILAGFMLAFTTEGRS